VIATGHTVTNNIAGRCQNLTVNGILQGSTTASDYFHIFGDLIVNANGTYRSFNGTNGRVTMLGGNMTVNASGTIDFISFSTSGTSNTASGANGSATLSSILFFCGGEQSVVSGAGTITARTGGNSNFYNVWCANSAGVKFDKAVVVSRAFGLYYGDINPNGNLTLGESAVTTLQPIERAKGRFTAAPTWATGITGRLNIYCGPSTATVANNTSSTGNAMLSGEKETISTGEEIETITGQKRILGTLLMNTFDNLTLSAPLYIGAATGSAPTLTLTKGIINSSATNLLVFDQNFTTSSVVTANYSATTVGIASFPSNHGSFVSGPIRVITATTGASAKIIPLGVGSNLLTNSFSGTYAIGQNYTINNMPKSVTVDPGGTWNGTDFTISIENTAPTGALSATPAPALSAVMGSRMYKIVFNNTTSLPTTAKINMRAHTSTLNNNGLVDPAVADNSLSGTLGADIRLAESPTTTGPWSNRNGTTVGSGSGTISSPYVHGITQTALDAGTSTADRYFAFGTVSPSVDLAAVSLISPSSVGCLTATTPIIVRIRNTGIATLDFATNNATITINMAGAGTGTASATLTSGTLAIGATQDVTLSPGLNLLAAGTYTFTGTATVAGDGNTANDALASTNVVNAGLLTAITSGNWSDPTIWCGGVVPTLASKVIINNGITVTVDFVNAIADSVAINTGGRLVVPAVGKLQVGPTCGSLKLLNVFGTLDITGGIVEVNGRSVISSGATFNMNAGELVFDPNDGTTAGSVASGTNILTINSPTGTVSGGKIVFVDPPYAGSGLSVSFGTSANATWLADFVMGRTSAPCNNPSTATNGFSIDCYVNSGILFIGSLTVDGGSGASRFTTPTTSTINGLYVYGTTTINSGSELRQVSATNFVLAGAVVNNGTLTQTTSGQTITFGAITPAIPQSYSGAGIIRNSLTSSTANFHNLLINTLHPSGFTVSTPLSVAGTLTLTNGVVNNGAATLALGISPAAAGTLVRTNGWINGTFKRYFGASTTTFGGDGSLLPIGTATNYRHASIAFATAPSAGGSLTAKFVSTDPGTAGLPLLDGAYSVDGAASTGYWSVVAGDGLTLGAATYGILVKGGGFPGIVTPANLRLLKRPDGGSTWALEGAHFAGSTDSARRTGLTSFSEFAIGSNLLDNPLPVKIMSFTASPSGDNALLNWTIGACCIPNYFTIERSVDGRNFTNVGRVNGVDNQLQYNFTNAMPGGTVYYRLRIVEKDGSVIVSNIVKLSTRISGYEVVGLFPTLVNTTAQVSITSNKAGKVSLLVSDAQGRIVSNNNFSLVVGGNLLPIDASSLPAGSYQVLVLGDNNNRSTLKFVKQ
jgi:hypothetical protein